ncbi:nuclear transport factor 2 family protein [Myxococcus sp. MISCRS1]|jgi:ketosteroid isomerase-like protein|uniref:nuclear transport factor 2 family protein n=1 Tax=Myxococcus TaxID=32 RepID=UPI001142DFD4|nr:MULTISPECIES: nuclear transport factor 2 family protein [Myxococcus]MBZ4408305.1 nuclear transport factor 2 family protein [Myxococcus sp. XM-1-1-1]MCK8496253.1 nuclear transport factor 2 family protein [Myxococcus fulvus]MCY0996579.1 nuclear transport factor 2 family protein [Myxococcus sp. MISCRS1]
MLYRFLAICALSLLAACAPKRIPGTEIDDTDETRAILAVMEAYRSAIEARDAHAIQALVSKDFREDAGTPSDPEDDLTAANLGPYLETLFPQLQSPKVEMEVRKVQVGKDIATAIYYWKLNFRMPGLTSRPQKEAELEQMVFRLEGNQWKILTGI